MSEKISIVMAVKDEEKYIELAIQSILDQVDVDVELIIVDDNSSDSTFEIIKSIASSDNRIVFERSPGPGKVSAFKNGCSFAGGKYIALFAGDDVMPQGSLAKRVKAIKEIVSPAVLMSKIQVLSDEKKIDGILIPKKKGRGNPSGASIIFDREAAKYLMDIPDSLPNEDTWMDFCITYLPMLNVRSHDDVSCLWRVHSGNSITIKDGYQTFNKKFSKRMNVIGEFLKKYGNILPADRSMYLRNLACAEEARSKGDWLKILFAKISFSDKARFLAYSNKYLYAVRKIIRAI